MRALVLCLLAACGDNAVLPDAIAIDAPIDAPIDGPTPPPGCHWGELHDADNPTTPEDTGQSFVTSLVMCGQIDIGHTVSTTMLVDTDAFGFDVNVAMPVRAKVELTGAGLEDFDRVEVSFVNRFGDPLATSAFAGAHAVAAATLPPGAAGIAVRAVGAEPAAAIPYVARISAAAPCATTVPGYIESAAPNDVIEVRYTSDPRRALTAAADAPEATGITVALATQTKLAGTIADVDAPDDFHDRDTFEFTSGTLDTISVQLDWPAQGADLDLFVFPANATTELAASTRVSSTGAESLTLAVLPNTPYWVWVGGYDASTLPADYTITLCGD